MTRLAVAVVATLALTVQVVAPAFAQSANDSFLPPEVVPFRSPEPDRKRSFSKSTAPLFPRNCWKANCSATRLAPLPAPPTASRDYFELGDRGTILLDEIAEMPPRLQAKLLQVLQEQKFFRLGSKSPVTVNIRILAATNVDIEDAIKQGKLRLDLYYRLNAFNVCLPPLRERREEIAPLFRHYMKRLAYSYKLPPRILTDGLLRACMQHAWPGNLRELHNFVKRYLVLGDDVAMAAELFTQNGSADRINSRPDAGGKLQRPEKDGSRNEGRSRGGSDCASP